MINALCQDWPVAVGFLWKLVSFMHLFLYIFFSVLFLFRSRSSNIAWLQLSHLCSEKDSAEGRVFIGVVLWTAWSFLAKSTKRHRTEGLLWDSADMLYPRAVWSDIFSLLPSWRCDIVMILVHFRLVFIESMLTSFRRLMTESSRNPSLELMSLFSVSKRNAAVSVKAFPL